MEFIKAHKNFLILGGAIAASAGLTLLLLRRGISPCAAVIEQPQQPQQEILGSDFQSKVRAINNKIQAEGVNKAILKELSKAIADLMIERESENLREDYYKPKQMRYKQNYAAYAKQVLSWLQERETLQKKLYNEQSQLIASCGLTEEQMQQVYSESQQIIDALIKNKLTQNDLNITKQVLSLKISFLREKGKLLFDQIAQECSRWDSNSLDKLPAILNIIISEQVYTQSPNFVDKLVEISWTFQKRQDSLEESLSQWDELISIYYENLQKSFNEKKY